MSRHVYHSVITLAAALAAAGCYGGTQSVLEPAGIQAERIEGLWWFMFWICAAVLAIVLYMTALAVIRARAEQKEHPAGGPDVEPDPKRERRMRIGVAAASALTTIILLVILFSDYSTGRSLESLASHDELSLTITGHQWWWEVEYNDPVPGRIVRTANEIHIPVGRTVRITTASADVIHSFWVPALQGKRDLVPGYKTDIRLRADRAGIYRGQCAEFCGAEHAKMAFLVVAEPPEKFNAWVATQLEAAVPPVDSVARRGEQAFMAAPCIMCHTIRGTGAGGNLGPDLTHLASRMTIGAGILPNRRGHLAGWISDPHGIKPGVYMPANSLGADDLNALLSYLENLK